MLTFSPSTKCLTLLLLALTAWCHGASLPAHRRRRATNDTPILTSETTTTPAPPVSDMWDESTTPEQQMTTSDSGCTYEQKAYAVNEEFTPSPCTSCRCTEGNATKCETMLCADCAGPPIYVEGQCCPECETTTTTTEAPTTTFSFPTCHVNGKVYSDGEEFQGDLCTYCTCMQGDSVCSMMDCPMCEGEVVYEAGQCCPGCRTTQNTPSWEPYFCKYDDVLYSPGQQFEPDRCTLCTCMEGGEHFCEQPSCEFCNGGEVPVPDQCCLDCIRYTPGTPPTTTNIPTSCYEIGIIYSDGEEYQRDPCTFCTCVQGQAVCAMMSCRECDGESVYVRGQCCPDCHTTTSPPRCQHNDMIYYPGEHFSPDRCTFCTCTEDRNIFCEKTYCEYCNGEEVPVPGQCCPDCMPFTTPTTPVDTCCRYGEETYALGEEFSPNPCTFCTCEEGGKPVCAVRDCAQCYGVPVPVPGQCCPDCIPFTTPDEPVETCCEYEGKTYSFGEEFSPDPCTTCRCGEGGEPVCAALGNCPACQGELIPVPGQCCPDCRPYPCETVEEDAKR